MTKIWSVYLLTNGSRTYVGSTTDPARRLRQHNGEIRGGARATRKSGSSWAICLYVTGFRNRSEACRWEALIKKRCRGLASRANGMRGLTIGSCPPGRVEYQVPKDLRAVLLMEVA